MHLLGGILLIAVVFLAGEPGRGTQGVGVGAAAVTGVAVDDAPEQWPSPPQRRLGTPLPSTSGSGIA